MILVGCDFHSRYQQIACVDTDTGDLVERRLEHENGEAFEFYRSLTAPARVGVSGRWWFGDKRRIRETQVIYLSC
jgi:hypothetical protein